VEAFAKPYPSQVIAEVMGAPLEDAPRLHHWSNWIQRQFDAMSMASEREQIELAVEEFYEYAQELVRARRKSPADDLISKLIAATVPDGNGQQGDRLSDVECINLVFNVLVAAWTPVRASWRMRSGCWRNTRISGRCWWRTPRWRRRRWRRRCATSRSRRSPPAS
jgi:cytochrome P450